MCNFLIEVTFLISRWFFRCWWHFLRLNVYFWKIKLAPFQYHGDFLAFVADFSQLRSDSLFDHRRLLFLRWRFLNVVVIFIKVGLFSITIVVVGALFNFIDRAAPSSLLIKISNSFLAPLRWNMFFQVPLLYKPKNSW